MKMNRIITLATGEYGYNLIKREFKIQSYKDAIPSLKLNDEQKNTIRNMLNSKLDDDIDLAIEIMNNVEYAK